MVAINQLFLLLCGFCAVAHCKQARLTPNKDSKAGASVSASSRTDWTYLYNTSWMILVSDNITAGQRGYNLDIEVDDGWAFDSTSKSAIQFEIAGRKRYYYTVNDLDLNVAVQIGDQYAALFMRLDNGYDGNGGINQIFPECGGSLQEGYAKTLADGAKMRRAAVAGGHWNNYTGLEPEIDTNAFPLIYTLTYDPDTEALSIEYTNSDSSTTQSCIYYGNIETDDGMHLLIAADDAWEIVGVTAVTISTSKCKSSGNAWNREYDNQNGKFSMVDICDDSVSIDVSMNTFNGNDFGDDGTWDGESNEEYDGYGVDAWQNVYERTLTNLGNAIFKFNTVVLQDDVSVNGNDIPQSALKFSFELTNWDYTSYEDDTVICINITTGDTTDSDESSDDGECSKSSSIVFNSFVLNNEETAICGDDDDTIDISVCKKKGSDTGTTEICYTFSECTADRIFYDPYVYYEGDDEEGETDSAYSIEMSAVLLFLLLLF